MAFDIAAFLAEDPEERTGNEEYKTMFETLYAATKKGKKKKGNSIGIVRI